MEEVIISSYEEFEKLVGQQVSVSNYVELSQERINLFAGIAPNHQRVYVDMERAKIGSPHHSIVAHNYLTSSILPYLWDQVIQIDNLEMMISYGMGKMKFDQVVLSGQNMRLVITLHLLINPRGVVEAEIRSTIEIED